MRIRDNKIAVFFIDLLVRIVFLLPILMSKFKTDEHQSSSRNILIIELWGLGDLVMMSSVLKRLRNGSSAHISLLCKTNGGIVFKNDNLIDEFIEFDFPWTKFRGKYRIWEWDWKGLILLIKRLRGKKFDLVLDARGDIRNNLLSFLTKAKRRVGYDWTGGGYFLTDAVSFDYTEEHRIGAWVNLLNYLGMSEGESSPFICVSDEERKWAEDFLTQNEIKPGDFVVGIHPGARIKTRCWALEKFGEIGDYVKKKYNAKVVVFVEPGGYGKNIPISGECVFASVSLRELIALFEKLSLFICNDGGAMHMASAVGTPLIAILGPTNPIWFSPYGFSTVVIKQGVKCRPCFDYCKFARPFCIEDISVNEVKVEIDRKMTNISKLHSNNYQALKKVS